MPAAALSSFLDLADQAPPLPPPPPTSARLRFPALVPGPVRRAPGCAEDLEGIDPVPEGEEDEPTLPRGPGVAWTSTDAALGRLVSKLLGEPEEPTLPGGDSDPTNPEHLRAIIEARDTAVLHGACVVLVRETDEEQDLLVLAGHSMPEGGGSSGVDDPYEPEPDQGEDVPRRDRSDREGTDPISYPREDKEAGYV